MAKFEITNPEALKLIEDYKSGALLKPIMDKIKAFKWVFISVFLFVVFLIFVSIGKKLFSKSEIPVFLPPSLDTPRITTVLRQKSEFDSLKEEIFNFSTDLPDPVMPDLNNHITLEKDEI